MRKSVIAIFGIFFLLLFPCSCSVIRNIEKPEKLGKLAQKAIFTYLEHPGGFLATLTGKGQIRLDPRLCGRETLTLNGKVYFDEPMHADILKYPLVKKNYRLVIPDSLAEKYKYTDDYDEDYEHDYAIIHQFSPLLPTTEPHIYLMEHHIWANSCDDQVCVRALLRDYLRFKIEKQKVTNLDGSGLKNQTDFIGFGGFSRKKMDEALPGEKIIRFGH